MQNSLVSGLYPGNDSGILFFSGDVVVTPYLQGSSSAIINLAHIFNRTVVATDVGGLAEQLDPALGDRLVPPGDPELLAAAIAGTLSGKGRRMTVKKQPDPGSRIKREWLEIAARHIAVYKDVCSSEVENRQGYDNSQA